MWCRTIFAIPTSSFSRCACATANRCRSTFDPGINGLESVSFVARRNFPLAQAHHRKTLRKTHARSVPPISAHRAAGHEIAILVVHHFVDVQMSLQRRDLVVPLE